MGAKVTEKRLALKGFGSQKRVLPLLAGPVGFNFNSTIETIFNVIITKSPSSR